MEKNKYVVLFFTQYGAIHYSKLLDQEGIENENKPVPRVLSSSCGVCVELFLDQDRDVLEYLTEDVEFIYKNENDEYSLIYENLE